MFGRVIPVQDRLVWVRVVFGFKRENTYVFGPANISMLFAGLGYIFMSAAAMETGWNSIFVQWIA